MVKKQYVRVSDQQRRQLVKLVKELKYSIKSASAHTGVPYANAKAIVSTYQRELRTDKKNTRFRLKKLDGGRLDFRKHLPYTKQKIYCCDLEQNKRICGIKVLNGYKDSIKAFSFSIAINNSIKLKGKMVALLNDS